MSRNAVHRLMLGAVLLAVSTAHAAIINVPGDEPTIQAGIGAAMNGDEVVVAQGEYFENINFLGKAITVRSTDPTDAGVVMATIINGGGSGSVVTCDSSEGSDTVLSGFVITNGNASNGGGMYNLFSSPTVTNCTFSGNSATGTGGGMYNTGGNPNVTNSTFSGNSAGSNGGGMFNNGNNNPTVTNCTFTGNTSLFDGGGMANQNGSSPTVTNCTFSGNSAGQFGGGMSSFAGSQTVTNCTFTMNSAEQRGGGMFNNTSNPTVTDCSFIKNTAVSFGGGMDNASSSPTLTDCSFSGNSANAGGGIFNDAGSNPTVTTCTFCANNPDDISGPFVDGGGNSFGCPCGVPQAGDCGVANGTPGCDDMECCTTICAIDPFCCQNQWDEFCALEAQEFCAIFQHPGACCLSDGSCVDVAVAADCVSLAGLYAGAGTSCAQGDCHPVACGNPASGDCDAPHATPGCADIECCAIVCEFDFFCCEEMWDDSCVETALLACPIYQQPGACCLPDGICVDVAGGAECEILFFGTFAGVGTSCAAGDCPPACGDPAAGDCCVANGNERCNDLVCCLIVCEADPLCCDVEWSQACADQANAICNVCLPPCGDPTLGSCCLPRVTPGCDDLQCCELICSLVPFCCEVQWDDQCAEAAGSICPPCQPGDCCVASGAPGCQNQVCAAAVCDIDPVCCNMEWNQSCADLANAICAACQPCEAPCPPDGVDEGEPICFDSYVDEFNNGCDAAVAFAFSPIALGQTVCGTSGVMLDSGLGDNDWYEILLEQPAELTWSVTAEFPAFLAIVDGNVGCAGYVVIAETLGQQCDPLSLTIDVEPGRYWPVVGPIDVVECGVAYTATLSIACPWDLNGSGDVGINDFLDLLAAWGPNPGHPADFDDDGFVGITDFLALLAAWGPCA